MKRFATTLLLLLFAVCGYARIILPSLLSSNMVLQQKSKVMLWGKSTRKGNVRITTAWDKKLYTGVIGKDSTWHIDVTTPAAGGPYKISLTDGELLTLNNVLIGEVWFCSGQSNMEMAVRGWLTQPVKNSAELLLNAENPAMRLFTVARNPSLMPLENCGGQWKQADAESVGSFSAVAYQYGLMLQQRLKVPVGLILSSWGGTKIETWMNKASIAQHPEIKQPEQLPPLTVNNQPPTALYNGMVHPVIKYGIKGFIWYQGEANKDAPDLYKSLFPQMVAAWRKDWNRGTLPFYYVQIAPYHYGGDTSNKGPQRLREVQLNLLKVIPNSGMAVTMDVGTERFIHAPDKITVGKRLAFWALANTYQIKGLPFASPVYKSKQVKNGHIIVYFDHAPLGLTSYGKELTHFEIAGADNVFYPAKVKILFEGLDVWADRVKEPVNVRYAFDEWVVGDLYNVEGFPASSFRTDSLKIPDKK